MIPPLKKLRIYLLLAACICQILSQMACHSSSKVNLPKSIAMSDSATVTAQVILRTTSGRSLATDGASVTSETIHLYRPAKATVRKAKKTLEKAGFQVVVSDMTLSLSGSPDLFSRYFNTSFERVRSESAPFFKPLSPLQLPADLSKLVETVAISTPPDFHY